MSTQPKPLRLADSIDPKLGIESIDAKNLSDAAAELRRLHDLNQELLTMLKLARDGLENWAGRGNVHLEQIDRLIEKAEGTPT